VSRVGVTSEVGRLHSVICHTPGPELAVVTPSNRDAYLFDDLLDLEASRREHRRFVEILERFATVYEVRDLLSDVLRIPEGREYVVSNSGDGLRGRAQNADADEIARLFIEGEESQGGELAMLVNEVGYELPPLPNLFFTRDSAAVIGGSVMIASMKHEVRWSEEVLMHALFAYHPKLENAGILFDGASERRLNTRLEGGDVHVARRDLLLIGLSERTSAAGIDVLAQELFQRGELSDIVVVVLPAHRSAIHLDMVFTQIAPDLCCVFPPYFMGPTRLPVLHVQRGRAGMREMPDLFSALKELALPLTPILCGGEHRTMQEREQWGSGCNFFSVGPGQVLAYERNEHTLQALERDGGFRIIDGDALLGGQETPGTDDRFVVTFVGSELVRGGGGPRCMTLPLLREDDE
jgi:arginine deiminase